MQDKKETEYLLSLYESLILESYNSKDEKFEKIEINTSYENKIRWLREERYKQKRKVNKLNDKIANLEENIKAKKSLISTYRDEMIVNEKAEFLEKLYGMSTFSRIFHKVSALIDKFAFYCFKKSRKYGAIKSNVEQISDEYREKHIDINTENISDHILLHGYKESRLDVLDESKSLIELKSLLKEIEGKKN